MRSRGASLGGGRGGARAFLVVAPALTALGTGKRISVALGAEVLKDRVVGVERQLLLHASLKVRSMDAALSGAAAEAMARMDNVIDDWKRSPGRPRPPPKSCSIVGMDACERNPMPLVVCGTPKLCDTLLKSDPKLKSNRDSKATI